MKKSPIPKEEMLDRMLRAAEVMQAAQIDDDGKQEPFSVKFYLPIGTLKTKIKCHGLSQFIGVKND